MEQAVARPFHTSIDFLVIPRLWRWEFLSRNPAALHGSACIRVAQQAGALWHSWFGSPREPVSVDGAEHRLRGLDTTAGCAATATPDLVEALATIAVRIVAATKGGGIKARRMSHETPETALARTMAHVAWGTFDNGLFGLLGRRGIGQWGALGVYPRERLFDPTFGPPELPGEKHLLNGPFDFDQYADLWKGLQYCFPDIGMDRWPDVEGRILARIGALRRRAPAVSRWDELSVRQQRAVRGAVRAQRRELGLTTRYAKSEGYYRRLLAVWDAREGWDGAAYNILERGQTLRRARIQARASWDMYATAFRLVTGQPYSGMAWEIIFGSNHLEALGPEKYQRSKAMPTRRRAGRPRKAARETPRAGEGVTAATIERLRQLLLGESKPVEVALSELALPDDLRQLLLDRDNAEQVRDWIARGCPV
jgi:hypothetical protein